MARLLMDSEIDAAMNRFEYHDWRGRGIGAAGQLIHIEVPARGLSDTDVIYLALVDDASPVLR